MKRLSAALVGCAALGCAILASVGLSVDARAAGGGATIAVFRVEPVPEGVSPAPAYSAPAALPSAGASPATPGEGQPAKTSGPALADVVRRYAEAIGGKPRLAKIRSSVTVYTSTLMGRDIVTTTTVKAPSSFLQVTRIEGTAFQTSVGFDGKTAWVQTPTGTVRTLSGADRADVVSQAAGANNSELFTDRWPTTVALLPEQTIDDQSYIVLSIKPTSGVATLLMLDPHTYRPEMQRQVSAKGTTTSVVQSFGTGPLGELQANVVTTSRSDGLPALTSVLRSVKDNVTVNDGIFAPPLDKGGETV